MERTEAIKTVRELIGAGAIYFRQVVDTREVPKGDPFLHIKAGEPLRQIKALGLPIREVHNHDPVVPLVSLMSKLGPAADEIVSTIPTHNEMPARSAKGVREAAMR